MGQPSPTQPASMLTEVLYTCNTHTHTRVGQRMPRPWEPGMVGCVCVCVCVTCPCVWDVAIQCMASMAGLVCSIYVYLSIWKMSFDCKSSSHLLHIQLPYVHVHVHVCICSLMKVNWTSPCIFVNTPPLCLPLLTPNDLHTLCLVTHECVCIH